MASCASATLQQDIMITGRQIREARRMLGWSSDDVCKRANIEMQVLIRAESVDGTPSITLQQAGRLQQSFERVGVRFGQTGAVMRLSPPDH